MIRPHPGKPEPVTVTDIPTLPDVGERVMVGEYALAFVWGTGNKTKPSAMMRIPAEMALRTLLDGIAAILRPTFATDLSMGLI